MTEASKHPFVLFRDLAVDSRKEWLVDKLLGWGDASAMYGKPGDGKSALAEDLGLHIAAGMPWHGRPVRRCGVLYVALERRKLVERRAIAFREHHRLAGHDLPFAVLGGMHDLRDPRAARELLAAAKQVESEVGEPIGLIEIDTLSRALCGGDENSPKDIGALVNTTSILQQSGAHILWLHHVPADGERMRGHGALLGALDTTIHVVKSGPIRTATVVKANDSEEGEQVAFDLESVVVGSDTTAPVVLPAEQACVRAVSEPKLSKNQQTMFSLLISAGSGGLTTEHWNEQARGLDIGVKRKADLYDIRSSLKSKGIIRQFGDRWTVS